ncbi:hypothetical protein HG15A2_39140 [Adhaeretor mobilis]|uniref:Ser-Thr-rich glycosyl-phosphatidyl-inositol-anchored membrane family protein n=1 Tax=Adhaeretor mobilis TaxID=1930276 RepID=A0A517N0B9_9BACT|nr:hypothetical protein HG15A2_39140 [Adhaeretor mobilis]
MRQVCAVVLGVVLLGSAVGAARFPIEPPQMQTTYLGERIFMLPYQVNASDPLASEVNKVRLLMSRGAAADWQSLQEAESNVRGFSYHCPADGEYWFAVQMVDRRGNAWPSGEIKPQIRLVVDTENPQLKLAVASDGQNATIRYAARDKNLKSETLRVEVRADNGVWRPVRLPDADVTQDDRLMGRARFAIESRDIQVRASIADHAGNTVQSRAGDSARAGDPFGFQPSDEDVDNGPSLGEAQSGDTIARGSGARVDDLEWPALNAARRHRPLPTVRVPADQREVDKLTGVPPYKNTYTENSVTGRSYPENSNSQGFGKDLVQQNPFVANERTDSPTRFVNDRFNRDTINSKDYDASELTPAPYRAPTESTETDSRWRSAADPSGLPAMLVSSRTFDVEYDLETVGRWGVARVEIWGTQDGGQTWASYAVDTDNRSPIRVTVPGSGTFGLKILVDGANGAAAPTPQAGDQPEMTVRVDLHAPTAELISAEIGRGPLADNLLIQWAAADTNLEERPIGLFYSSHENGPWSTVATDLENTGQYAWRIERHVPDRFYLKVEARDTAGNVTAAQTPSPVVLSRPKPAGRLRGVRPISNSNAKQRVPVVRPLPPRDRRSPDHHSPDQTAMEHERGQR